MFWPTIFSSAGYMAAISTIDAGGTGSLHAVGAGYFFICLYFLVLNLTIVSRNMRKWDVDFMSRSSLINKIVVAVYINLVFLYCLVMLLWNGFQPNDDEIYGVIIEWNLVYGGLVWVLCYVTDFKDIYIVFKNKGI
jgi:hypothetical protein